MPRGIVSSTLRSADRLSIARFHTEPPEGLSWARNLRQFATASASLPDNARLLAMLSVAFRDAGNGCFESKYQYNFWCPLSAIPLADTDGNPATEPDLLWTPVVVPTPNHPEYPAAHGCASGAVMEAVRSFYETKNVSFDFNSMATGTTHHFDLTDDLVHEIRDARVWGGHALPLLGQRRCRAGQGSRQVGREEPLPPGRLKACRRRAARADPITDARSTRPAGRRATGSPPADAQVGFRPATK